MDCGDRSWMAGADCAKPAYRLGPTHLPHNDPIGPAIAAAALQQAMGKGLTPYEYVARIWTEDPVRFKIDPYRYTTGLNN